jgi:transcription elongation GreA/GreB family factor
MDAVPTQAETEAQFLRLMEQRPLPAADLLTLVHTVAVAEPGKKADEWAALLMQELTEAADFAGLYLVIKDRTPQLSGSLKPTGIRDLLKKACKDRLVATFVDAASFGDVALAESFRRLDLLLALTPGTLVIDPAWGLGTVKRLDDFYKRITVDFAGKSGHVMTFGAACDTLARAPHDHLLTLRHNDPEGMKRLAAEKPGELVRLALRSFGDMPVTKLEDVLVRAGFVPAAGWKSFWESARKALKSDPLVTVPAKRTDPLQLRAQAESYADDWFERLASNRDPLKILEAVAELEETDKFAGLEPTQRGVLEDRLAFAVKGAHNTDPALYARLAVTVSRLGFLTPPTEHLRAHLWEQQRFVKAAETLAVRDVAAMTTFLLAEGGHAAQRLLDALTQMPFSLLSEVLAALKDSAEAAEACRRLLSQPKCPPTLVNWLFRYRKDVAWQLPPLIDLLNHAIVIVEAKLSGESLRMQNSLKQLFEHAKWLESVFEELDAQQRQLLFERIQASAAWDPTTHRSLIGRMLKLDPSLAERKKAVSTQSAAAARLTSWHSLAERQLQYKRLIEVELPKNSHDIAVARSYGDLRENFEYQAAKDYQRQLLQKQSEMQNELKLMKGSDFAGALCDKAAPGTTVSLRLADGSTRAYTILGEWDRDESLNIISNKTRMAQCLDGKAPGDRVTIPGPSGDEEALVEAVQPLSEAVRAWISSQPTETAAPA